MLTCSIFSSEKDIVGLHIITRYRLEPEFSRSQFLSLRLTPNIKKILSQGFSWVSIALRSVLKGFLGWTVLASSQGCTSQLCDDPLLASKHNASSSPSLMDKRRGLHCDDITFHLGSCGGLIWEESTSMDFVWVFIIAILVSQL